ncbi:Conserved oligomeric Golgi complex subunit 2 [Porphyridium purpureum]|uniref:Conserved oligomeric Golgi complex subunit 2 n=1 Tax=Porphyridium purpureum TaxID=35688 RepID=A0A5J4YT64_PORPP|nr:Conserved oligomeric Golgi complex subunit 2 [Porphyridium purpureum]|eukprot:POR9440..scf227_4
MAGTVPASPGSLSADAQAHAHKPLDHAPADSAPRGVGESRDSAHRASVSPLLRTMSDAERASDSLHTFCVESLSTPDFDLHEFISALRARAPLPALRDGLRLVLQDLNHELVTRIQADFNAFVSLGTSLSDAETLSETAAEPMRSVKRELEAVLAQTESDVTLLSAALAKRKLLSQRRRELELLLRVSELLHKCERLLRELRAKEATFKRTSKSADVVVTAMLHASANGGEGGSDDAEEYWRMIERISGEFSQLSFSVSRSEAQGKFVESERERIDTIQREIVARLDALLRNLLVEYRCRDPPAARSPPNAALIKMMQRVLSIYASTSLVEQAERVFGEIIVTPFVARNLTMPAALAYYKAHAKERGWNKDKSVSGSGASATYSHSTGTSAAAATSSPSSATLAHAADAMTAVHDMIEKFMAQSCAPIVHMCTQKGTTSASVGVSGDAPSGPADSLHEFDFVSRVVWPECVHGIQANMGQVFSPGIPNTFHRCFRSACAIYAVMEKACPLEVQLVRLHDSATSKDFWKRWNLAVYFQLRFQQITVDFVATLEQEKKSAIQEAPAGSAAASGTSHSKTSGSPAGSTSQKSANGSANSKDLSIARATSGSSLASSTQYLLLRADMYHLPATHALLHALRLCWDDHIFLPALAGRFLRLSLQCIARYKSWVQAGLDGGWAAPAERGEASFGQQAAGSSSTSTPQTQSALENASLVYSDIKTMESRLLAELASLLRVQLGSDLNSSMFAMFDSSLAEGIQQLCALLPSICDTMVRILSKACVEGLQPLRGILATYRMTNKPPPTQFSRFVPNILKPLRVFFGTEHGGRLPAAVRLDIARQISEACSIKYFEMARDLIESVKKAEDVLKRLSLGKQPGAGSGSADGSVAGGTGKGMSGTSSDVDKISLQLYLDVRKFGSEMEQFGLVLTACPQYSNLWSFIKAETESRVGHVSASAVAGAAVAPGAPPPAQ